MKITGVSIGPFGLSWEAAKRTKERTLIEKLLLFLEDRRVLYSPAAGHSVATHFVVQGLDRSPCLSPAATGSILEIREELRKVLEVIPDRKPSKKILKRLLATCRWALDCAERMHSDVVRTDPDYEDIWGYGVLEYGMTFLGLFRRKMGRGIRELADLHGLAVEGPLRGTIEMGESIRGLGKEAFKRADDLVPGYMKRHSGFRDMSSGWYERLCAELAAQTRDWEN